jgi:hypothetical protein
MRQATFVALSPRAVSGSSCGALSDLPTRPFADHCQGLLFDPVRFLGSPLQLCDYVHAVEDISLNEPRLSLLRLIIARASTVSTGFAHGYWRDGWRRRTRLDMMTALNACHETHSSVINRPAAVRRIRADYLGRHRCLQNRT